MARGGYHPLSRLETTLDEIRIEAQAAAGDPSPEQMRRAFDEIGRLADKAKRFALATVGTDAAARGFVRP